MGGEMALPGKCQGKNAKKTDTAIEKITEIKNYLASFKSTLHFF